MLNLDDFIYNNSGNKVYKTHCDKCGSDRGYKERSESLKLCKSCTSSNRWRNKSNKEKEDWRKKISCSVQKITINDFGGFKERYRKPITELSKACFIKANYICDICKISNTELHAHHKNSWKDYPEQRYDINNLVCLCKTCHRDFHKEYGNKDITEDKYEEYRNKKALLRVPF